MLKRLPITLLTLLLVPSALGATRPRLERAAYAKHLRGMWLAQSIANWTGLRTEAKRNEPPFFTDADWGKNVDGGKIEFVFQSPWGADDDTDIEYIYLHLMSESGSPMLTPLQIARGWNDYIRGEEFIWVSNLSSLRSIRKGVLPPATGLGAVNSAEAEEPNFLMIDAQLTTEFFGAIAPGAPEYALKIADLPIRNTAGSYAAHAAQQFVLMYSLAPVVDPNLDGREKVIWLARETRKYIPDTSKIADIFDFVIADFLRNCPTKTSPGCRDWEKTRDRIYDRYHKNAEANGFIYYDWYEAAVNYGTGILALLYGQGDLKRTIQVGTLSGWDSDNGTATMGGLLGLMNGYEWVAAQFPGRELSDRYRIYRTRGYNLPDRLPGDSEAEDTFTLMAERMLPLVEEALRQGGGRIEGSSYHPPALPSRNQLSLTPTDRLSLASANVRVRRQGGRVEAVSSTRTGRGRPGPAVFADGIEHDFSGTEPEGAPEEYWAEGKNVTLSVAYDREVRLRTLRLIEGGNHDPGKGYFKSVRPQILIGDSWRDLPAGTAVSTRITAAPYQIVDWVLPMEVAVRGLRLQGDAAGGLVSVIEIDALSTEP